MSLLLVLMNALEQAAGDVVTVSGQVISKFVTDPTDAHCRLKVDANGNIYESEDTGSAGYVQIDTGADWVRPTSSAPGLYEVRYTSLVGDALTSETAAEDTWYSLSSGDYELISSQTTIGSKSSAFTIEIRLNGGSVLDSGSYSLSPEVDSGV